MIPTGRISFRDSEGHSMRARIVLGDGVLTYQWISPTSPRWVTCPLSDVDYIEWDAFPFEAADQPDEIEFLRAFIEHLSPDELEAAINAKIAEEGMHTLGEWVKAALLDMVPK